MIQRTKKQKLSEKEPVTVWLKDRKDKIWILTYRHRNESDGSSVPTLEVTPPGVRGPIYLKGEPGATVHWAALYMSLCETQ